MRTECAVGLRDLHAHPALHELQRDLGQAPWPPWPRLPSAELDGAGVADLRGLLREDPLLPRIYFCLTPLPGACGPELISLAGPNPGSSGGECRANEAKVVGQSASLGGDSGFAASLQLPHWLLGLAQTGPGAIDQRDTGSFCKSSLSGGATGSQGPSNPSSPQGSMSRSHIDTPEGLERYVGWRGPGGPARACPACRWTHTWSRDRDEHQSHFFKSKAQDTTAFSQGHVRLLPRSPRAGLPVSSIRPSSSYLSFPPPCKHAEVEQLPPLHCYPAWRKGTVYPLLCYLPGTQTSSWHRCSRSAINIA